MGLFDFLQQFLQRNQQTPPLTPAVQTTQAPQLPQPPSLPQGYLPAYQASLTAGFPQQGNWMRDYAQAAGDVARGRSLRERGLLNMFLGRDARGAEEMARVMGPGLYFDQLSKQPAFNEADAKAKAEQLKVFQNAAQLSMLGSGQIDLNNPYASLPQILKGMAERLNGGAPTDA